MIEVIGLHAGFASREVLKGVSLRVTQGERIAVLGGNGSGKSTLAGWLAGWFSGGTHRLTAGGCLWNGRRWEDYSLVERAATVQLVGQFPAQHISGRAFTVAEEIAFGPENLCLPTHEIITRRDEALSSCRLAHLADRDPFTLSGGEQQRLVIASALALRPKALILDEPFSNLDPEARSHTLSVLNALPSEVSVIIMDTSPDTVLGWANRLLVLHEGRLCEMETMRAALFDPAVIATIGLPSVTRGFLEIEPALEAAEQVSQSNLPLILDEAAAILRRSRIARA